MPNLFVPLSPGTSLDQLIAIINNNFAQLDNNSVTNTFKQANGQTGEVIGRLPNNLGFGILLYDSNNKASLYMAMTDNGPVFKIAKTGSDATTGSDDELVFNSAQNVFKIVSEGTATIPSCIISNPGAGNYNSNNSTVSVAHGVTGKPAVIAFLDIFNTGTGKDNYYQLPYSSSSGGSTAAVFYNAYFFVDNTNVTFGQGALCHGTGTTLGAVTVKYYILQETAN